MTTKTQNFGLKEITDLYGEITFASALNSLRLSEEKTLKEYSDFLGISIQRLSDLEKGRRIPSPSWARDFALKIGHPILYWIELSLQDKLRSENINLKVTVTSKT